MKNTLVLSNGNTMKLEDEEASDLLERIKIRNDTSFVEVKNRHFIRVGAIIALIRQEK